MLKTGMWIMSKPLFASAMVKKKEILPKDQLVLLQKTTATFSGLVSVLTLAPVTLPVLPVIVCV